MQDDKNLFTEKVPAGKRTYFFDVMENHKGHRYIKFTESRANDGEYIRHTVRIFQEDFDKIFDAFEKMKGFIQTSSTQQPDNN
ncbi:MAG: hypothetical protein RLZZ367_2305 [Bacteroidota bacterium]|jgi:phospholipase C